MKRSGYDPVYAGAVEACASTGGCLMPPVMGAAAFIMASFLNVPYAEVVTAAFLPAVLFYLALMPTVIDLTRLTLTDMLELAVIVAVVVSIVLTGYVLLAAYARRMFTSPRALQTVNRAAGTAMAGAAVVIVTRN